MEPTEVRVKLVLDSNAEKVTESMKKDLDSTNEEAKKSATGLSKHLTAGAVAVGNIYFELAKQVLHFGKEALTAPLEAYAEQQAAVKQLAGTFSLLEKSGADFFTIKRAAAAAEDELGDLAVTAGVAGSTLVNVFDNVIGQGRKSIEEAHELTEQMVYAGKAVPGGAEAIADAFEKVQMGMVNAKNPLVGMIATTGILKGNARQVAKEMMKMSPEKQMETAEKAVAKMAEKMKGLPMSFKEAMVSLGEIRDNMLEAAGGPMQKGLTKAALTFRGMFVEDDGKATELTNTLTDGAEKFGKMIANAVDLVKPFIYGFVDGLHVANEEFKIIWDSVFEGSKENWELMKDAAKITGELLGGAVKMFAAGVGTLLVALKAAIKYTQMTIGWVLKGAGALTPGKAGDAIGDAGNKIIQGATSGERNELLKKARMTGGGDKQALRDEYIDMASSMAISTGADMQQMMSKFDDAIAERRRIEAVVSDAERQIQMQRADDYVRAFGEAAKVEDQAAMENIARFLGSNKMMAEAIGKLGPDIIEGGLGSFIKTLEQVGNKDMADVIKSGQKPKLDIGKTTINQTFGPVTIKQDFRDQDPDRVVLQFRRDLARAGVSPLQSRVTSPFGV